LNELSKKKNAEVDKYGAKIDLLSTPISLLIDEIERENIGSEGKGKQFEFFFFFFLQIPISFII